MQLLIAGDLVPTKSNEALFIEGDTATLLGSELNTIWNSVDVRLFNLEVPMTYQEDPIPKCGPNLISSPKTIKGIKKLNPTLITLANNHILDQGIQGLISTQTLLDQNNIPFVGVGNNIKESARPYIFEKDAITIGVYACSENEFSIATDSFPGANPFNPLESLDHINELKSQCDYAIVLYHGGKEHYRYPSPYLQKVCRKMVEKGADVVICQHSHCIGSYEVYEGSTIIYGQGNFIFDRSESEYWQTSLIIKIDINNDGLMVGYIPVIKMKNCISLAVGKVGEDILKDFYRRSNEILQTNFIQKKYLKLAEEVAEVYLRKLSGFGKWTSRVDRYLLRGALLKRKYKKSDLLALQNYIECEAHRELLLWGLKGANGSDRRTIK